MKTLLKGFYTLIKIGGAVLWIAGLGHAMEQKRIAQK